MESIKIYYFTNDTVWDIMKSINKSVFIIKGVGKIGKNIRRLSYEEDFSVTYVIVLNGNIIFRLYWIQYAKLSGKFNCINYRRKKIASSCRSVILLLILDGACRGGRLGG